MAGPKNATDVHVGNRICQQRNLRGLSQAQLAEKLGVEIAAMQEFESGSRRIGAARLCQVARILGVAPVGFFEGESTAMQDCADGGGVKGALAGIRRILSLEQLRLDALGSSLPDGLRRSEITDVLAVVAQLRDVLD